MIKKILSIYILCAMVPLLTACVLLLIFSISYWAIAGIIFTLFCYSIFMGLAFHYSLSQVIEHLEEMLSSIRIEAVAAALPTSEPVFTYEKEDEQEEV